MVFDANRRPGYFHWKIALVQRRKVFNSMLIMQNKRLYTLQQ